MRAAALCVGLLGLLGGCPDVGVPPPGAVAPEHLAEALEPVAAAVEAGFTSADARAIQARVLEQPEQREFSFDHEPVRIRGTTYRGLTVSLSRRDDGLLDLSLFRSGDLPLPLLKELVALVPTRFTWHRQR